MIPVPPGVRVLIATRPIDFRKGADSLAALAKETLAQDPFAGLIPFHLHGIDHPPIHGKRLNVSYLVLYQHVLFVKIPPQRIRSLSRSK